MPFSAGWTATFAGLAPPSILPSAAQNPMTTNVVAFHNCPRATTLRLPGRPPIIRAFSSRERAAEHLRHPDAYVWERGGLFIVRRRMDGANMVLCADRTWRDLDIPWLKTSLGRRADPAVA